LTGITYHHGNKPSGSLHTPLSNWVQPIDCILDEHNGDGITQHT
jgi:hypothetical protein